jgi:hypothetical protein
MVIAVVARIFKSNVRVISMPVRWLSYWFPIKNQLVTDTLRAFALIWGAYVAGGNMGYNDFLKQTVESADNPLQRAAVMLPRNIASTIPIVCQEDNNKYKDAYAVIGDIAAISSMEQMHIGCSIETEKKLAHNLP